MRDSDIKIFVERCCLAYELSPDTVRELLPQGLRPLVSTRAFTKSLIEHGVYCRSRGHFDSLRACLVSGTLLLGGSYLIKAERAGLLLSDPQRRSKYGRFLKSIYDDLKRIGDGHPLEGLRDRLITYLNYHQLAIQADQSNNVISAILRKRPRKVVKNVFALTNLHFLRDYMGFTIGNEYADFLSMIGSPEDTASIASFLAAIANESQPLESMDFSFPVGENVATAEVQKLFLCGRDMVRLQEIAKHISFFGHRLELVKKPRVFCLRPPSHAFEYAMRLGFIRQQLGAHSIGEFYNEDKKYSRYSLVAAAEYLVAEHHDKMVELKDSEMPFRRIRVQFPPNPQIYKDLLKIGFREDHEYPQRLAQEFLTPLRRPGGGELMVTKTLDLKFFWNFWRLLSFMSLADVAVLRRHQEGDPGYLYNSLVRISQEEDFLNLLRSIEFDEGKSVESLNLIAADAHRLGYYDMQYKPILRIAPSTFQLETGPKTSPTEMVHLPGVLPLTNIIRNLQSANQIRLELNAAVLVEIVESMLRKHFSRVARNRRVSAGTKVTDIDVVLLLNSTLYLFECKHSLPPTNPHELRAVWEDIERAAEQLSLATDLLSDPVRRQAYLAGWFPGTTRKETDGLILKQCIVCSHLVFSGMEYAGIPVRDFASMNKVFSDGTVGMGEMDDKGKMVVRRFRVTFGELVSQADLDDYLSQESRYFKVFLPFMGSLTRLDPMANSRITIGTETYRYAVAGMDGWISELEALGFARLPDEIIDIEFPYTAEELQNRKHVDKQDTNEAY